MNSLFMLTCNKFDATPTMIVNVEKDHCKMGKYDIASSNIYVDIEGKRKVCDHEKDCDGRSNAWVIATFIFALTTLILLISLITWAVILEPSNVKILMEPCIERQPEHLAEPRTKRSGESMVAAVTNGSDVFAELSKDEIKLVLDHLNAQTDLKLVHPKKASLSANFIHAIELKLPDKPEVLAYINDDGVKPERKAAVFIFKGSDNPPSVEEYVVGGIGSNMYSHRIKTNARKTKVPYEYRPFSTAEFMGIFRNILANMTKMVGKELKESYGATPMKCGKRCLKFSMAPVASSYIPKGTRKSWFWFQYDVEFPSVYPVDFQFLVDMTSHRPEEWKVENIWYANQYFQNISHFQEQYHHGNIRKTRLKFPDDTEQPGYGSMEFRYPLVPEQPLRPPRQYEPDGPRFQIVENEIHYMKWKTNFRVSTSGGLQLLNVRFNDERIVYEMSMQEVIVMYSGHNPASRTMNFADGAGMYGTRFRGLMPGVDCPAQAKFVDTYLYTSNEFGGRIFENAFCVFEQNLMTPLRRHRAYGRSGALYGGLEATALVVRSIISIVNYDYVFDFLFYATGGIETKVSMTGYLGTTFFTEPERDYGTRVHDHVAAPLHNHLFSFKVDLDIKGVANRYETHDIKIRTEKDPWAAEEVIQTQAYVNITLKDTELNAVSKHNFDAPKYHIISNHDTKSKLGNARGYRILVNKASKQLMPEGYGFENAISWSRYQMAMTKYKPEEERSSSLFTMWDARDPVINFQKYLDDDDNLVDEDLVAWVTIGTQHLPQTENLPTTTTRATQLSFQIIPFNYFDEDPSMTSRDGVRITPKDKNDPLGGASVEQFGALENSQCTPVYDFPLERLESNSTFLFS